MAVFAVIAPASDPKLEEAIKDKFAEGDFYKIAPGQFLVYSSTLTTRQASERLGISSGVLGSRAMVLRVTTYAGWHSKDMWEWIAAKTISASPSSEASEATGFAHLTRL
jgi:hypothetical protein